MSDIVNDPNTILVVNPQRMRDLFAFAPLRAPEPAGVWGESLTSMAWRPWCVLKNPSTGRRLVVNWPLMPYYADRLVRRSS